MSSIVVGGQPPSPGATPEPPPEASGRGTFLAVLGCFLLGFSIFYASALLGSPLPLVLLLGGAAGCALLVKMLRDEKRKRSREEEVPDGEGSAGKGPLRLSRLALASLSLNVLAPLVWWFTGMPAPLLATLAIVTGVCGLMVVAHRACKVYGRGMAHLGVWVGVLQLVVVSLDMSAGSIAA